VLPHIRPRPGLVRSSPDGGVATGPRFAWRDADLSPLGLTVAHVLGDRLVRASGRHWSASRQPFRLFGDGARARKDERRIHRICGPPSPFGGGMPASDPPVVSERARRYTL